MNLTLTNKYGSKIYLFDIEKIEKGVPCRKEYLKRIVALDQQYAQCSIAMEDFIKDLINEGVDTFVSCSGMKYRFFIKDKHVFVENKTTSQIEKFGDLYPHFQKRFVNYLFDQLQ